MTPKDRANRLAEILRCYLAGDRAGAFGRRHVAPVLGGLLTRFGRLRVQLALDERLVDLVAEGFDVAIRIGMLADSAATMRKLADNRRILVAAPTYGERCGRPSDP